MKRIGVDFDNTIVSYDEVFHKYALQAGLIDKKVAKNKQVIRDVIRTLPHGNDRWTELQGMVYGAYMQQAQLMPGVENFFELCKKNSFKVSIISHKTVYPFIGPRVNLQDAAKKWLENNDFFGRLGLSGRDVVFLEKLDGKLRKITELKCEYFIDDLIEVFEHADFPQGVNKLLYCPQKNSKCFSDIAVFKDWDEITKYFFG